jgi:hypothetical protein
MNNDAMWQSDLNTVLHSEKLFIAQHQESTQSAIETDLNPTRAETEQAVANIRAWRSYLPGPCVQRMIDDGWQWST